MLGPVVSGVVVVDVDGAVVVVVVVGSVVVDVVVVVNSEDEALGAGATEVSGVVASSNVSEALPVNPAHSVSGSWSIESSVTIHCASSQT